MSPRLPIGALAKSGCTLAFAAASAFAAAPNFGPNVLIFDPGMSSSSIQSQVDKVYSQQQTSQFGSGRYALLFKPGSYSVNVDVGFYTQVLGLGQSPDDTVITGYVESSAAWLGGNADLNFDRGAENLAVIPTGGTDEWAVSQASPLRRMHIKGNLTLSESGYSSGGFLADSVVDGEVESGTQQQWLTRSSQLGSWVGAVWNMVFVGVKGAPAGTFPAPPCMVVNQVPVVREKPFLTVDGSGNYSVLVPSIRRNSAGPTWSGSAATAISIPISQFYIAQAGTDTAETMNGALSQGMNLLLTPGIYPLDEPISVTNANTVVLGLGIATLAPENGVMAMAVSDVDGVIIAGILFDAGPTSSPVLLQVGPPGSSADHTANPTSLHDLFFRVGGAAVGQAAVSLEINSSNVIGDDFWAWRADHGTGVGWTTNVAPFGLIVNGANVVIYGLAVEHYQKYQTQWNANGGQVYFYQSEAPYDPPSITAWMDGAEDGFPSYKVAGPVTSHQAYGLGIYCYFDVNPAVILTFAIEAPAVPGVQFLDMTTVSLGGVGQISAVINSAGGAANSTTNLAALDQYPATGTTYFAGPSSMTNASGAASFSGAIQNAPGPEAYQWQVLPSGGTAWANTTDGATYTGSATSTLNITGVNTSFNGNEYRLVATSGSTSVTSSAATLGVAPPPPVSPGNSPAPTLTAPPQGQTLNTGSTLVLTVVASGATSFEWFLNGSTTPLSDSPPGATTDAISGSGGPQLVITNATQASAGSYTVVATSSSGSSPASAPAAVSVVTSPTPGALANLSARGFVGTGANILIGGFVIQGSTSRTILIQAIGPALAAPPFSVPGTLQFPTLSVHQTQGGKDVTLYSNTAWGGSQLLLVAAASVGAEPVLQAGSADSELLLTLPPGAYTAEVSGADGGSGVALCAIYQLP